MLAPVRGWMSKSGSCLGSEVTLVALTPRVLRARQGPSAGISHRQNQILRTGETSLLVLRFVRTAMSGAAVWAIVITRCRPHILPFFLAPVALVKVAEEVRLLHGSSPSSSGTLALAARG